MSTSGLFIFWLDSQQSCSPLVSVVWVLFYCSMSWGMLNSTSPHAHQPWLKKQTGKQLAAGCRNHKSLRVQWPVDRSQWADAACRSRRVLSPGSWVRDAELVVLPSFPTPVNSGLVCHLPSPYLSPTTGTLWFYFEEVSRKLALKAILWYNTYL